LGDNTVRQAAQTKREINRTITPEEALELFGEGGDILLKNLDKYNQENGTNFNTFDELIKGMKDGQAITFGDGESGFNVGNRRIPISKHGKPIYRPGDIVDSLTMRADGRFSVAGHTYDPLSSKRYFMGETKLTTTGLNQDASEDEVALRKAVATELFNNENVAFGVDGSGDLNARKVMGDLIGKIKYIQNSLINNNGAMDLKANEAFKQISIGNGRTLGDLMDTEGFWSNNFATGNPEDFASLLNTLINDDG
jgi:hypothetical protein